MKLQAVRIPAVTVLVPVPDGGDALAAAFGAVLQDRVNLLPEAVEVRELRAGDPLPEGWSADVEVEGRTVEEWLRSL